jgi:hypothetical protein
MLSKQRTTTHRVETLMETTEIVTRVAGVEMGRNPLGIVRVALEGKGSDLLLQLTEEAATQLLAYLLEVLPKRGLRK